MVFYYPLSYKSMQYPYKCFREALFILLQVNTVPEIKSWVRIDPILRFRLSVGSEIFELVAGGRQS